MVGSARCGRTRSRCVFVLGFGSRTDEDCANERDHDQRSEREEPRAHLAGCEIPEKIRIERTESGSLAFTVRSEHDDADPENEGRDEKQADSEPHAREDELEAQTPVAGFFVRGMCKTFSHRIRAVSEGGASWPLVDALATAR